MKMRLVALAALLVSGIMTPCQAQPRHALRKAETQASPPYIGCWSDASGDYLSIAARRIKYGRAKWVKYAKLPQHSGDNFYLLRLFSPGEFNFLSNIISLSLEGEEMRMTLYESLDDYSDGKKLGWATWYRDKCGAR
jgi:hypothetical protein